MDTSSFVELARQYGTDAGKGAAGWVFDGNTDTDTYRAFLAGLEDGDPAVLDNYSPVAGWLSGEWADTTLPDDVFELCGVPYAYGEDEDELTDWQRDEILNAYEDAAEQAYWSELERIALYQTAE